MKRFLKGVVKYYKDITKALIFSLFPRTYYEILYLPQLGYTAFLTIERKWFGQVVRQETFELADTPEKKLLLDELLRLRKITKEEYEKYLSPLKKQK